MKIILLGTLLAVAIIFLYPLYQSKENISDDNSYLESRLQRVSRELNLSGLIATEAEITENVTQELTVRLESIQEVQGEILSPRGVFTENLQAVTEELPEKLYLALVDIDKEMIIIEGEADSVFTVIDYVTELENKGLFSEVSITELDEESVIPDETEEEETLEEIPTFITFKITIIK